MRSRATPKARQPTLGAFWAELVDAARPQARLDMTAVDDPDANDGKTAIDMQLPMAVLGGTIIMGNRPAAPEPELGKTMPLTGPNAPPQPNALRAARRHGAHEPAGLAGGGDGACAVIAAGRCNRSDAALDAPAVAGADDAEGASHAGAAVFADLGGTPLHAARGRARSRRRGCSAVEPALVALLLLFVVVSLSVSTLLLTHLFWHR